MTEWYGPIQVNGKRPAWLADADRPNIEYRNVFGHWLDTEYSAHIDNWSWGNIPQIRIPADHWAVAPLKAGYEPWTGGENAPDDWDGKDVMFRDGDICQPYRWTHDDPKFAHNDIIGYRKRKDADEAQQDDKPNAATRREDVIREVVEVLRGLGANNYAADIERLMIYMSDVERMAREMHAQSMAGITPWERLTDWTREGWLKTAKWAIEHGARLGE